MSRDHALMERHVEALYTHDAAGRLVRVREHNGAPAPRFFLGRTAGGAVCRCRHDVGDALWSALAASAAADPVDFAAEVASDGGAVDPARYVDLLARATPVSKVWGGPAFRFPTEIPDASAHDCAAGAVVVRVTDANVDILRPLLPAWVPDVHLSPPLMALLLDAQAVAVCGSVRITAPVHEAGVDTAAPFRGRGYAPRVVAAWARAVRALGAEPLYSTSWQNAASRAVARKLGLVLYGTDLSIS
jgi:RimJ/RimL family protein N-acetyltransferase